MQGLSQQLASVLLLGLSLGTWRATAATTNASRECRCFPGDACWPSEKEWSSFNSTVGGKLVKTIPVASVCHDPHYDAAACEALRAVWLDPDTHIATSHSPMTPFFANRSCDPFTDRTSQCVVGTYIQYAVNVASADDVIKTIAFAKRRNLRFVIRNTGHDYMGKSTGPGGLAVRTQNFKTLELLDWKDEHYAGKALKMGAGVLARDAVAYASDHGVDVLAGDCPSVGVAGGYIQGGGHSPLSSKYGLAADNTLEFEVVDGNGQRLIANRKQNSDIYWAMSGGGGGTYGVALSVTVKAHPGAPVTLCQLGVSPAGISHEDFIWAIAAFNKFIPTLVDAGCTTISHFTREIFEVPLLTGPGMSYEKLAALIAPYLAQLTARNISYSSAIYPFPNMNEYYKVVSAPQAKGSAGDSHGASWFTPRSVFKDLSVGTEWVKTCLEMQDTGMAMYHFGFDMTKPKDVYNAVFPGWREMLVQTSLMQPWNKTGEWADLLAMQDKMMTELVPRLKAFAPKGGMYLNEADYLNKNWKEDYYGSNYGRLLQIKQKYDPDHVFYGSTAVGGDLWIEGADHRLCRAACK